MEQIQKNPYDTDGNGIPLKLVAEMLNACEYASPVSIGCKLLMQTGARISELDAMYKQNLKGNWLYWGKGKNQKGARCEYLSDDLIQEIKEHWKQYKTQQQQILSVSHTTFGRYWRKHIRPKLSKEWQSKRPTWRNKRIEEEYKYMLKGLRKNFATILFAYYWKKYSDPYVAVQLTCKRMGHSSDKITVTHYIEAVETIHAERHTDLLPFEILNKVGDKPLLHYMQE